MKFKITAHSMRNFVLMTKVVCVVYGLEGFIEIIDSISVLLVFVKRFLDRQNRLGIFLAAAIYSAVIVNYNNAKKELSACDSIPMFNCS